MTVRGKAKIILCDKLTACPGKQSPRACPCEVFSGVCQNLSATRARRAAGKEFEIERIEQPNVSKFYYQYRIAASAAEGKNENV